jgi:predicted lipid-binding transport protein (Tim44 family)
MANTQLLVIVAVAMVAGVILFRLYTVLGRRTGNERERLSRFDRAANETADSVVALPDRNRLRGDSAATRPLDDVEQALVDIKLADRTFETDHFVSGAKKAHELIVTAYAKGDRETLRPLLNDEVFDAFDHAIKDRQSRGETVKFTLVGYKDAKIPHASLKGRMAEITVSFAVQFISSTSNAGGTVIEGDPAAVRDVTDVWTFSRDLRGSDPNWTLVATSGGEF